jgi:hypothetical protein
MPHSTTRTILSLRFGREIVAYAASESRIHVGAVFAR